VKILFLDIETAPNLAHIWGLWKQNVGINQLMDSSYTMCWAAKWQGESKVRFASVQETSSELMLKEIHTLLDETDAVCHYNGTKFDIPTLNKEFLLHGFLPPSPYKQIDLLKTARSRFRFPSNKLDYVSQQLGLSGKVHHEGHELWVKCMAGDPAAWKKMKTYNKRDVTLLEEVYDKLLPWVKGHPNQALYNEEAGEITCPHCNSSDIQRRGFAYLTSGKYQRFVCNKCGVWTRETRRISGVALQGIT